MKLVGAQMQQENILFKIASRLAYTKCYDIPIFSRISSEPKKLTSLRQFPNFIKIYSLSI